MNTCQQCGGAIMTPGLSYGYAGTVCMCSWRMPVTPMPQAQIDEALVLAMDADKREIERLCAELAASQARERVLHNATVGAAAVFADYAQLHLNKSPPDYEKAGLNRAYYDVLAEALSRASDDTALREMLTQAQEEMRERIAQHFDAMPGYEAFGGTIADDIRALEVKP